MKKSEDILQDVNRRTGMTVPDGYFDDFTKRMTAQLPVMEWEKEPAPKTLWMKLRPFVYMAAMFAGIWLMLQMFNMMRPVSVDSIENSTVIAQAINDDSFMADYYLQEFSDYELMSDMVDDGVAEDFVEEIESGLKPETL